MNNPFKKLFAREIDKLESYIDGGYISEGEGIKEIQDLEDLREEIEGKEDMYSDESYTDQLSTKEQENHDYWENSLDPVKNQTFDVHEAENLVAEEDWDMTGMDDMDDHFIIGKKEEWDTGPEADDSVAPVIENENPHTAPEDLTGTERKEAADFAKRSKRILKQFNEKKELEKKASENVSGDSAPANLPVEQPRTKQEVVVDLEAKEKAVDEVAKYAFMKEVMLYNRLLSGKEKIFEFRPMRGETPLSNQEILDTLKSFDENKEELVSPDKEKFIRQCRSFAWATAKIKGYEKEPLSEHGKVLTLAQIKELSRGYYEIHNNQPEKFAQLEFALAGNKKVESGEWKKAEFAWQEQKPPKGQEQRGSVWYSLKGKDTYYSYFDPSPILDGNKSAEFFYTVNKENTHAQGKNIFISIQFPQKVSKQEKVLA